MKKSRYNYIVKQNNQYLIYNALNCSCVVLEKEEYNDFKKIRFNSQYYSEFVRLGFYVPDDYNEVDAVCFSSRLITSQDRRQYYRIYTTYACNARCPYCYEAGIKPETMSIDTANDLCKFINKNIVDGQPVIFEWFGGEPLINTKIIDYICSETRKNCELKNAKFYSRMISNGLLFNESIIEKAKNDWNLTQVQITIDGLKETYERIKGFSEKNAFEKVLDNIELLLKNNINVSIRLNYDKNNFEEIKRLIKLLGERFSKYKGASVYVRRVMGDKIDNSLTASAKTDLALLKEIIKAGFVKDILSSIPRRDNTCVAHMLNSYMVLPNGNITKCSQAGVKGDIVGNIKDGVDEHKIVKWCSPRLPNKCLKCKMLPLCNGGCLYEKFLNKNFCFASEKILYFKLKEHLKNIQNIK